MLIYLILIIPFLISPFYYLILFLPFGYWSSRISYFLPPLFDIVNLYEPFTFYVLFPLYSVISIVVSLITSFRMRRKTGNFPKKFILITCILIVLQPTVVFLNKTLNQFQSDNEKEELIGKSETKITFSNFKQTDNLVELTDENSYRAWKDSYYVMEYTLYIRDLPSKVDFYRLSVNPQNQKGEDIGGSDQILFQQKDGKWTYDNNFEYRDGYLPLPSDGKIVRYMLFNHHEGEKVEDVKKMRFWLENEDEKYLLYELEGTAGLGENITLK